MREGKGVFVMSSRAPGNSARMKTGRLPESFLGEAALAPLFAEVPGEPVLRV
jgi:hypothetical protein